MKKAQLPLIAELNLADIKDSTAKTAGKFTGNVKTLIVGAACWGVIPFKIGGLQDA